jgi:Kef-type K+ transport system membrane component KefB
MDFSWLNLFLVLLVAWVAGAGVSRLGYPSVLGELTAGILFGPPILGLIHGDAGITLLGRLGILMMVLFIGTQVHPSDLLKAARGAALPALGGFAVPFLLGYLLLTRGFGANPTVGLLAGVVMSTTALVTMSRVVVDLKLLGTRVGQLLMTAALFSILLVLVTFSLVQGIARAGTVDLAEVALVLGKAGAFLGLTVLVGRFVFPLLGRIHGRVIGPHGQTSDLTFAILLAVVMAWTAERFGLNFILGGFMAGLFLRPEMFERDTFPRIFDSVRDVSLGFLAPIFYVSAGFNVSFAAFQQHPGLVVSITVVALLAKFLGGFLFALLGGMPWRQALVLGLGMNARGSVDIIVAGMGLQLGLITREIFTALLCSIFLGMLTMPVLLKLGRDWLARRGELDSPRDVLEVPARSR